MKINKWFTTVVIAVCGLIVTGCASQVPTAPTKVLVAPTDKRLTSGEVPTWLPNGSVVATGPCADETVMAYSVRIPTQTTTWSWGVPPGLAVAIRDCQRWLVRYQQMAENEAIRDRSVLQQQQQREQQRLRDAAIVDQGLQARQQCKDRRAVEEQAYTEWQQCRRIQLDPKGGKLSETCADIVSRPRPAITTVCR